ncbi:MAG: protein kinase [bacterium]
MLIMFQCPSCGNPIKVHARMLPTHILCARCGSSVETPLYGIGTGAVIGGFRVEKSIGRGAMGEVFVATQLSMDRKVALKIMPSEITADKNLISRFQREIRLLARVEHPNLVTAFEAGEYDGVYYLAMTYVEGKDLGQRLEEEKRIPEQEALAVAAKAALALAYAWEHHQILHNDVKPGNIMIDRNGEVKVMDMGLSKCVVEDTSLSMEGVAFGTPNYMSPEQARGQHDLDFRSDEYALGATLFHLLTGALPHNGTTVTEVLTRKTIEPAPNVRQLNPDVSPACERLILKMMAPDREERFPSWTEAIAEIESLLESGTVKKQTNMRGFGPPSHSSPHHSSHAPLIQVAPKAGVEPSTAQRAGEKRWSLKPYIVAAGVAVLAGCVIVVAVSLRGKRNDISASLAPPSVTPEPVVQTNATQQPEEALQVYYEKFTLAVPGGSPPAPADDQAVNEVIDALEKANPDLDHFQVFYRIKDGFVSIDMSGNKALVDIAPIHQIPVRELRMQSTSVTNLAPLEGLPIEKLVLNDTPVADLRSLSQLPLQELSLWQCRNITDLGPLAEIHSLVRLLLPEQFSSIDFLHNHPSLQYIATEPDGWKQTAGEFWAQLAAKHP